jgi:outer membrane protein assembly factor BamB
MKTAGPKFLSHSKEDRMPWSRALAALVILAPTLLAADWPQWLGPHRDGATSEKVAPWKGPLKVLWRQPVGEGHSSPVVADGRVYLHVKLAEGDTEALQAFDAAAGKPLWSTPYPRAPYKGLFGSGPRATPTVAGGKVYTYGITGILTCFDARGGKQLWQVDTLKEFKASNLFFGMSGSPLVEKALVLINVGGKGAAVVAYHKDSGKVVWHRLSDGASYSSPIVFGEGAKREVVFLTKESLVGLHPADGTAFWRFPFKDKLSESSTTPVRVGDLLIASSITAGSVGLRLKTEGDKPAVSEVWKKPELTCYFSTPVAVGKDHLYMVTGALPPAAKAILRCVEAATGKELWQRPGVGKFHASLLRTGDNKLLMLEEKGDLVLIDPSPQAYRELARAHVCGQTWAHPALANGRLYVRDSKELICLELPQ